MIRLGAACGEDALTERETPASTGEVSLRDVTENDLRIFFEHQLDPEANRMAAFPARDRDAFVAHWKRILGDDTITKKTVLFDGRVAGNVVSFEQDGKLEVGYWIARRYWGKGVATSALSAFLSLVRVRPLYAHVAKHTFASIRVLEKCGFEISAEDTGPSDVPGGEVEGFALVLGEEGGPAR
jgi:RimJ/RimL family protein N-acetyltransferase